jgi:hypothetical protein
MPITPSMPDAVIAPPLLTVLLLSIVIAVPAVGVRLPVEETTTLSGAPLVQRWTCCWLVLVAESRWSCRRGRERW